MTTGFQVGKLYSLLSGTPAAVVLVLKVGRTFGTQQEVDVVTEQGSIYQNQRLTIDLWEELDCGS